MLYVLDPIGTNPAPMVPLVEYILEYGRTRSLAWQREVTRAVGLFVDYLRAQESVFISMPNRPEVLACFADALVGGTIDGLGNDPAKLYWIPESISRSTVILTAVTEFSDWLSNRYAMKALNPWRNASVAEQIAYWRRFEKRKAKALLRHTMDREDHAAHASQMRTVSVLRKSVPLIYDSPPSSFPDNRFLNLIATGFSISEKEKSLPWYDHVNIRNAMVTILLHAGGLSESEPFHLFVNDVAVDPNNPKTCLVKLFHPEQGRAPEDFIDPLSGTQLKGDRETYLRVKWGLEPRNLIFGRFHAGWKDLQLSGHKKKFALGKR